MKNENLNEKESEVSEPTDNDYQDWDGTDDANDETDEEPEETDESEELTENKENEELVRRAQEYYNGFFNETPSDADKIRLKRITKEYMEDVEENVRKWNIKDESKLVDKLKKELACSRSALDSFDVIHLRDKKTIKELGEQVKTMNMLKEENTKDKELIQKLRQDIKDYYSYTHEQLKSLKEHPEESANTLEKEDIIILDILSEKGEMRFSQIESIVKQTKQMTTPTLSKHMTVVLPKLGYVDVRRAKDEKSGRTISFYSLGDKGKIALQNTLR